MDNAANKERDTEFQAPFRYEYDSFPNAAEKLVLLDAKTLLARGFPITDLFCEGSIGMGVGTG